MKPSLTCFEILTILSKNATNMYLFLYPLPHLSLSRRGNPQAVQFINLKSLAFAHLEIIFQDHSSFSRIFYFFFLIFHLFSMTGKLVNFPGCVETLKYYPVNMNSCTLSAAAPAVSTHAHSACDGQQGSLSPARRKCSDKETTCG